MDLRQVEYIVEISKFGNISKAAQSLNISQSALNQQLLKLEDSLGTQLFMRSRGFWQLTEAGRIYIEAAEKILDLKHHAYSRIGEIVRSEKTELRLGLTPNRGITMFVEIYPELQKLFPNTRIYPIESSVVKQQSSISEGKIDLGFMTLTREQETSDSYILIAKEEIVALVPRTRSICSSGKMDGNLREISIRDIADEEFIMMYKESTIRMICDRLFSSAGIIPKMKMDTSSTPSVIRLAESMDCCSLVPRYYADPMNEKLETFKLKEHPTWGLYISYKAGAYLDSASREYIRLVKEYWEKHKPMISV